MHFCATDRLKLQVLCRDSAASAAPAGEDSNDSASCSAGPTPHTLRKGKSTRGEGPEAIPDTKEEFLCVVRKRKSRTPAAHDAKGSDPNGSKHRKIETSERSAPSWTLDEKHERGSWTRRRLRKEFFDPKTGSSFGFFEGTVVLWAGKTDTYQIMYDDGDEEAAAAAAAA